MSETFGGDTGFHATPGEGRDTALTDDEQKQVSKLLGDPTYFPIEFRRWLKDYIENSNIQVSKSQIIGGGGAGAGDATELPPGVILPFGGSNYGKDCVPCDGRSMSRTDYPELFSAIGTTWGSPDSDHFNVPDLRDRALYGTGSSVAIGQTDGKGSGSRGGPSHSHTFSGNTGSAGQHSHGFSAMQPDYDEYYGSFAPTFKRSSQRGANTDNAGSHSHSVSGSTSGDTQNRDKPSFAGVQYVITLGREVG